MNLVTMLAKLLRRGISASKTVLFSWPDAGADACKTCHVERRLHASMAHAFVEVEA